MMTFPDILFVAGGGAVGSVLRHLLAIASLRWGGTTIPGTLAANLIGCFAIGMLVSVVLIHNQWMSPQVATGIRVGLLGGLTTFSTFALEAIMLSGGGKYSWTLLYLAFSVGSGLIAVWAGMALVAGDVAVASRFFGSHEVSQ